MWKRLQNVGKYYLDYVTGIKKREDMIILIPFWIIVTILFFLLYFLFSNWESKVLWVKDKISTNDIYIASSGMSVNDNITIKWTCESFCDTIIIYNHKEVQNLNFKNSGNNIFLVYVNDGLIFRTVQYKSTYWKGYEYKFIIKKTDKKYDTNLLIED